jgi:hypothetical protein
MPAKPGHRDACGRGKHIAVIDIASNVYLRCCARAGRARSLNLGEAGKIALKQVEIDMIDGLAPRIEGPCGVRKSRSPGDEPDQLPMPASDRIGTQPRGIRSPRCGPRHSRFR